MFVALPQPLGERDVSGFKSSIKSGVHGLWLCSFLVLFFYSHKVAGCLLRVFRCEMGDFGAKLIQNLEILKNSQFLVI